MRDDRTRLDPPLPGMAAPAGGDGAGGEPAWMADLRRQAWGRFTRMEWPTPLEEEWRRTPLGGIDFGRYRPYGPPDGGPAGRIAEGGEAGRIVFSGPECLRLELAEPLWSSGVRLLPLERALREHPAAVRELFLAGLETADNRLQVWHYSLWTHGVFLYLPAGVEVAEPFRLEFAEGPPAGAGAAAAAPPAGSAPAGAERAAGFPHLVVLVGRGARATIVETYRGAGQGEVLCVAGADMRVEDGAAVNLFSLQDLSESSLWFSHRALRAGRDATVRHFEAVFGGRLAKTRTECLLEGPGADAQLNGVYFARGSQHLDLRTVQRHRAPAAVSRALYKGAVQDAGYTVYQGLIDVSPGASKTDAYLSNRNLILNDGARADSIPSLKIDNNDLRCSHGSTTGRVSEEELFYLMTRGLPREEAREMLVQGYFEELFRQAPEELADGLRERVRRRITAGRAPAGGAGAGAAGRPAGG